MTLLLMLLAEDAPPTTYEVDVRAGLLGLGWTRLAVIEAYCCYLKDLWPVLSTT
jgi:hypothetical protein